MMNILKSIKEEVMVPIHPAGWPFIFIFFLATALLGYFWILLLFPSSLLCIWCIYFFRNPSRITPKSEKIIVSPADGRILSTDIQSLPDDLELPKGEWRRISIFMNVFDVHVNRAPVGGKVTSAVYHKGSFVNASLDKASEQNERQTLILEMKNGQKIGVVQIAGLVARRILLETAVGDYLNIGQQFGMIRFGSRVDVWIPSSAVVRVLSGQKAIAGETLLAEFDYKPVVKNKAVDG